MDKKYWGYESIYYKLAKYINRDYGYDFVKYVFEYFLCLANYKYGYGEGHYDFNNNIYYYIFDNSRVDLPFDHQIPGLDKETSDAAYNGFIKTALDEFGSEPFPMVLRHTNFPHSAKKKDMYESPFEMALELYLEEYVIDSFKIINTYVVWWLTNQLDKYYLEHDIHNGEIIFEYMHYKDNGLDKVLDNVAYAVCPLIKVAKNDLVESGYKYLQEVRRANLVYNMYGINEYEDFILK